MLFQNIENNHFNVPDSLFIHNSVYKSFTKVGTLVKGEDVSPNGANALSISRQLSIRKSFSEMIERRSLLLGGKTNYKDQVPTWDMVRNIPSFLPHRYTIYQTEGLYISDTTGTATHTDSRKAIQTAIQELLEKNALYLFWYGKKGYKLKLKNYKNDIPSLYFNLLRSMEFVKLFVNDTFYPLFVVFVALCTHQKDIYTGIGSSFLLTCAIQKAIEEAYVLKWQKEFNYILNTNYLGKDSSAQVKSDIQLEYLLEMDALPYYISSDRTYSDGDIRDCFPKWLTNLHIIMLQNELYPLLKCVKVFSLDLYNHVPIKQYLKVNQKINVETVKISKDVLCKIPDCIFV
ncbi:YcaO-like family protein [Anoxybacillus flavithermus]|uniref:YcaO-like family protein n=1 Tax=Anoxybacillus flavithermus TaxID=33934 RepID=UPI0007D96E44|nr:YcaO-like family protein [Anoxybacillus flavithermus]MBE2941428.1 hypothetical protein [Anoxybacillus flavithermus]MBE2944114.1 hypothetical protein [Anoxybacillus flavithermus]MBE2952332.1 hypothetical protein [Anoxybacillus flavithermus]MBE2955084.1 hypothetical protein [Anoxybacillus flavithermus]MBE2960269.1 hypothetical protein [Anoxybacillus flavithermus]